MDESPNFDSEWNGASAYFFRIHVALVASDEAGMRHDRKGQLAALFTVHREIVAQMLPQEKQDAEKLFRICNKIVNDGRFDPNNEVWKLYEYETHLRQVLKRRKMDLPRSKDPGRAIIGGKPLEEI